MIHVVRHLNQGTVLHAEGSEHLKYHEIRIRNVIHFIFPQKKPDALRVGLTINKESLGNFTRKLLEHTGYIAGQFDCCEDACCVKTFAHCAIMKYM